MSELVAVFRVDAGIEIGFGHIVRCLTLADGLSRRGWECIFVCRRGVEEEVSGLTASNYRVVSLDTVDEVSMMRQSLPQGCDLLVVDHYEWDARQEQKCRGWASRVLVIDDLANRHHDCDFLLDQTLERSRTDYVSLVGLDTRLLLGVGFALLRPQFRSVQGKAIERHENISSISRILISMGGTDPLNMSTVSLRGIATAGLNAEVDIVIGSNASHLEEIQTTAAQIPQTVRILVNVSDMAQLMIEADVAIGAGGTSSWERCCMGLPCLVIVTADNQLEVTKALTKVGAIHLLGQAHEVSEELLARALMQFEANPKKLTEMSRKAAMVCDGLGEMRTVIELLPPIGTSSGNDVRLRFLNIDDTNITFAWQCDERTRRYSRNPSPPSFEQHRIWLEDRLSNEDTFMLMVLCDDDAAGILRLDRSSGRARWEVSIHVAPKRYRQGVASAALTLARKALPNLDLWAQVLPDNHASVALFTGMGYEPIGDGWFRNSPVH